MIRYANMSKAMKKKMSRLAKRRPRHTSGSKKGQFKKGGAPKKRKTAKRGAPKRRKMSITALAKSRVSSYAKRLSKKGFKVVRDPVRGSDHAPGIGRIVQIRTVGSKKRRAKKGYKIGAVTQVSRTYRVKNRRRNASAVLTRAVRRSPNRRRSNRRRNAEVMDIQTLFAQIRNDPMSVVKEIGRSLASSMARGVGQSAGVNATRFVDGALDRVGIASNPVVRVLTGIAAAGGLATLNRMIVKNDDWRKNIDAGAADTLRDVILLEVNDLVGGRVPLLSLALGFASPAVSAVNQARAAAMAAAEPTAGVLVDTTAGVIETQGAVSMIGAGEQSMPMAGLTAFGGEYMNMG